MARTHDYGPTNGERELARYAELVSLCFGMPMAEMPAWMEQYDVRDVRVLRAPSDRDDVVAGLTFLPMGQWFGGRRVAMTGVMAVGTFPHARGSGAAKRVMQEAMRELAARGEALTGLYPATNTLYRAVGYEHAGARYELTLKLREIELVKALADHAGTWLRPITTDDEPAMRALYAERAKRTNGWLDRHEYLWKRVRRWRTEERQGYGVGHGEVLEGYVFTAQRRSTALDQEIGVSDLVATTPRAAARILRFLRDHRSLCPRAVVYAAPSDPIVAMLAENAYESKLAMPWMLRVVDVKAALEQRGYPRGIAGEVELDVTDELIPANAGRWRVSVEDGRAKVERSSARTSAIELDVKAFASLFSGWHTAEELALSGRARGDAEMLARTSALFAGPPPHMPDMF